MLCDVSESFGRLWFKPRWNSIHARGLFSFRTGGTSYPPFQSFNLGLHVGDIADNVIANRHLCSNELGTRLETWVVAQQVHGNQVAVVDESFAGLGAFNHDDSVQDVDGLVTNSKNVTLAVLSADCVPILFYDPVCSVIATAHSGWKGTLTHIVCSVVETMKTHYGSNPKDILVNLGPSIRKCCYEVSDSVALSMLAAFGPRVVWQRFNKKGHWLLSLQDCILHDLQASGVDMRNISDCGICTSCHNSISFSYRKEGGKTGRLVGAICLPYLQQT